MVASDVRCPPGLPASGSWVVMVRGGGVQGELSQEGPAAPRWVPLTTSLPAARFLSGDNGPGSSASSDTEEDALPANKCKKVWGCVVTPSPRAGRAPWALRPV